MEVKCYFCDQELGADAKPFKIGMKEELVCNECFQKTVNRRATLDKDR